MSRASEYAAQTAAILQNKAAAIAEGKRNTGNLIGSTIATLGQVIPQQVQAVMKANAEKRKNEQIQGIFQKHGTDLPAAINEVMGVDPVLGSELAKRHGEAQKLAGEYKASQRKAKLEELDFTARVLGSAKDQDSWTQSLLTLKEADLLPQGVTPNYDPAVADRFLRSTLSAKDQIELSKPKDPQPLMNLGGGAVFDPNTRTDVRAAALTPDQVADNARMADAEKRAAAAQAETVRHNQALEAIGRMQEGRAAAAAAETARHNRATEGGGGGGGTSKIPAPYQLALGRATLNLPNVRRGNVERTATAAFEQGGEKALADVVREAAIEGEPVAARDRILGRMSTIASLNDAADIMKEMQRKGVPTNILRGTAEDVARKLGTSTNPEYVRLATLLNTTMINYRRSLTGAAFGQQEGAEYAKLFPGYKNTLPVNLALIDGLKTQMDSYDKSYWQHKLGAEGAELMGVLTGTKPAAPPPNAGANTALAELERRRKAAQGAR